MSYILDALRKVERQRPVSAPGISTVHATTPAPRLRIGPMVYLGLLLAGVAALVWVLRPSSPAPQPAVTARPAPERVGQPLALPPSSPVQAERCGSVSAPPRSVAGSRSVRPPDDRAPAPPQPAPAAALQPPSPAPQAAEPPRAPAAAIVAKPVVPPTPQVAKPPAVSQRQLPPMKLEVLVYSDDPAERIVFINGRKYVEGQTVEGGAVVERIDPDGVLLIYEGQPAVLRN